MFFLRDDTSSTPDSITEVILEGEFTELAVCLLAGLLSKMGL